eukprot:CAMPEP_0206156756 /NCGR_PEP_ID=MMETSP1474-20131121/3277_1 /ASSEMBLY_ACC=CAM_ASM_001110 /TAXON_ID=97495 /ORGANISM="Imantonia sp., Strain RCC918" /LENGTH=324 /DNA_ID=CAMNT_0053555983 /DNA_START=137 /DNA_END=1110 /DNA_ORIENTATION=-
MTSVLETLVTCLSTPRPAAALQEAPSGGFARVARPRPTSPSVARLALVRSHGHLEQAVFGRLLRVAADHPAGAGRVDDGVKGLGSVAAVQVERQLRVAWPLQKLGVGPERLLPDVLGPSHELRLFPGVVDGEALGLAGGVHGRTAVHAGPHWGRVEHVLCDLVDLFRLLGARDENAALEGELGGAIGGDLEDGSDALLEAQRGPDGERAAIHAVVHQRVHAAGGPDPHLDPGHDWAAGRGCEDVLHEVGVFGHLEGFLRAPALDAKVGLPDRGPQYFPHLLPSCVLPVTADAASSSTASSARAARARARRGRAVSSVICGVATS